MAFVVGDIVKRTDSTQKYEVVEVLPESRYGCKYYPYFNPIVKFTFKESELELVT